MKIYMAYDVNPRLLLKSLKDAKQPLIGIRIHGPAIRTVPMACFGCEDAASDNVVYGIMEKISGEKPSSISNDHEQRLRKELEAMCGRSGQVKEAGKPSPSKGMGWLRFLGIKR